MQNIKLTLEYDGTGFVGWQTQAAGRSVQGEIAAALAKILREEVNLIGAGRTDAGVHAAGQAANFRLSGHMAPAAVLAALNGVLPPDIRILAAEEVPEAFHARFDARARRYLYRIARRPTAIGRQYVWQLRRPLDLAGMQRTAALIPGEHDFGAFCRAASDAPHHRCTVFSATWGEMGGELHFAITGNRFLHGMVRALVGTMVEIGRGYRAEAEFPDILASRDRRRAGIAAPARGLILQEVLYDDPGREFTTLRAERT